MDDPDEDWEYKEQTSCEYLEGEGGGKGNVRWILEKGITLGKKAVITGFVMSSAPVVLPPMLVVSAVGFAFSVPFGLAFTGYVCTQKLMSTLLPMPIESPMLEYDQMFYDETKGDEWKGGEGNRVNMEKEENEQMDYLRAGVEERIELVKNDNEVPINPSDRTTFREEEGDFGVTESTVEGGIDMGKDRQNSKPEGDRVVAIVSGEQNGPNAIASKEKTEDEEIRRGSVSLLEKIKEEGNADDATKKTKKKRNKNKKTTSKGSAERPLPDVEDQSVITKNQQSGPEKRQKPENSNKVGMQQRPVKGAVGSDKPLQENRTATYPPKESEKSSGVTVRKPEAKDGDNSSKVDEEKIWEQIDSLRTIVGYKATPHRSSIEEVKALYIFAGVELPSSFGDQLDDIDLSNKLSFLMSVLGVK